MKLHKRQLREIAALLRSVPMPMQPPGPVTRESIDRAADDLLRAALLRRKPSAKGKL